MRNEHLLKRHNVNILGQDPWSSGAPILLLAHGFGCDQQIWAPVANRIGNHCSVILFDHMGCGQSDRTEYDSGRYSRLDAYAEDIVSIVEALRLPMAPVLVGHSVAASMAWLASLQKPGVFERVIALGPSPRYVNDPPHYRGGFDLEDVEELLDLMERNHFEWAGSLAPQVMGGQRIEDVESLRQSFLRAEPDISRRFAEVTFLTDIRNRLSDLTVYTIVLYAKKDVIVPFEVIDYLRSTLPNAVYCELNASGHYPQVNAPASVADALLLGVGIEARN